VTHSSRHLPGVAASLSVLLAAAVLACGCGGEGPTPSPAPSRAPSAAPSVHLTPVPGGATPSPLEPSGAPTQTDTAWGRIWDDVPDSFPHPSFAIRTDIGEAVSAAFSVGSSSEEAANVMQAGLAAAGYTTDRSGALEDGSIVLDSTGAAAGCQVQTKLTPLSGTTLMTVMFGASCPFE
jgi:hypothetical protein